MKRRLLIIAMFVLLGAVVNVAVAWGCAVWSVGAELYDIYFNDFDPAAITEADRTWLDRHGWQAQSQTRVTFGDLSAFGLYRIEFFEVSDWHLSAGGHTGSITAFATKTHVGWPVLGLTGEQWLDRLNYERFLNGEVGLDHAYAYVGAVPIDVEVDIGGPIKLRRPLPLRPLWPGFAINTLFCAAILWLLIPGPFALRRFLRLRRGLCPKCAYPMGESAVCSECGVELPSRIRCT